MWNGFRWVRVTVGGPIDAKRNYIEPHFSGNSTRFRATSGRLHVIRIDGTKTKIQIFRYFFFHFNWTHARRRATNKIQTLLFPPKKKEKKMLNRLLAFIWAAQRWPVYEQKVVNCFFTKKKKLFCCCCGSCFWCWCSPIRIYWFDCLRTVAGCRVKQVLCTMNRPSNNSHTSQSSASNPK